MTPHTVPSGWAWTTIGDVATLIRGVSYRRDQAESAPGPGLVPLLRATNITERLDLAGDLVYVPESCVSARQYLQPGDIVLATSSGSASVVGKSAFLEGAWHGTFGAFCGVLRPKPGLNRWVRYWVTSRTVRDAWSRAARGSNINNLKVGDITSTPIPVPPEEQREKIIQVIEEEISRLDSAASALRRVENRVGSLRAAVVESLRNPDWPTVELGSTITSLRNGVFVSRPSAEPPGTPILRISAVRPGVLNTEDIRYAPDGNYEGFTLDAGDLLFTRYSGNPRFVGSCAVVPATGRGLVHPDKLIRVVGKPEVIDPHFVSLILNQGQGRAEIETRLKTTAGQVGIAGRQLRTVPIPLPPVEIQRQVVAQVDYLDPTLRHTAQTAYQAQQRATSLRSALLSAAYQGLLTS